MAASVHNLAPKMVRLKAEEFQGSVADTNFIDQECLKNLRVTNPYDDKDRIETDKGGLLRNSYRWILDHVDFKRWQNDPESRLLWIKGEPGKGKTMLLCGIIDELSVLTNGKTTTISFFFCQAAEPRINNATAVLRGLLYLILDKQPALIPYIQKEYYKAGKKLFEGVNAWHALSRIFTNILKDPILQTTYLIIDGLDECTHDLPLLLQLVSENPSTNPNVKWIVSSRNLAAIEESLDKADQKVRLCLELNENSISEAVNIYIHYKVQILAELKNFDAGLLEAVRCHLLSNALGTFLWVALVCEELKKGKARNAHKLLNAFPAGLDPLYERMMVQIQDSEDAEDAELCRRILAVVAIVYRPITLEELPALVEIPDHVSKKGQALVNLVEDCGCFLSLRGRTISLVHQSATDFLLKEASSEMFSVFPQGITAKHHEIFWQSLQAMCVKLRRDIYNIKHPGFPIERIRQPTPDPLAIVRYSCVYWVDHLQDCDSSPNTDQHLQEGGAVDEFLRQRYLHWIEALSLLRSLSQGIAAIVKLDSLLQVKKGISQAVVKRVSDASRFIRYHRVATESSPLQVYSSSLIFSPTQSITKICYRSEIPGWLVNESVMADDWSSCLQTLEEHDSFVMSVAWSPDGSKLASGLLDKTVRIWDPVTGQCTSTLEGHHNSITSIAWSPKGNRLASGSNDKTVRMWDPISGQCTSIFEGHHSSVTSITWSPDGSQLASGSWDKTVRIWDPATDQCTSTVEGHSSRILSIAWSPNGSRFASGSEGKKLRIWDPVTGQCTLTLEGHHNSVTSITWSPDGSRVASGSDDNPVWFCDPIRIWDPVTGQCTSTLEEHHDYITSIAWSPDGNRLASGSNDKTVRMWDPISGQCTSIFEGHHSSVTSITWSPDGSRLASGSLDKMVRIWDPVTDQCTSTVEGHSSRILSIVWSPDGSRVATGSKDETVRIWDPVTGQCTSTLKGHHNSVTLIVWSPDGSRVASGSRDEMVRIWGSVTGQCTSTLEGHHDFVTSIAWSPDGSRVASGSKDKTVRIWDSVTGQCTSTLEGHHNSVTSITWSPDGSQLASGSDDRAFRFWDQVKICDPVRIWDPVTGQCTSTLEGHRDYITSIDWSPDGSRLASGSCDKTVRVWDPVTGQCTSIFEGHHNSVISVAWSPDESQLASGSCDKTVRIWDPVTGQCTSVFAANFPGGLQFDKDDMNHLHTNAGTFNLRTVVSKKISLGRSATLPQQTGYGLNDNRTWITYKGENLLWLPSECRPDIFALWNTSSNMAIGCSSGRVLIFSFSNGTSVVTPQNSKRLCKPNGYLERTFFSRLFNRD